MVELNDPHHDLVTCVCPHGADVFCGTGTAGIWRVSWSDQFTMAKEPIASSNDLGRAAVLCLAIESNAPLTLLAGTSAGIYRGQKLNGGWTWHGPLAGPPPGASVAQLLVGPHGLIAGTMLHGLWEQTAAGAGRKCRQLRPQALANVPTVQAGAPVQVVIPLPGNAGLPLPGTCLHSIQIVTQHRLRVTLSTPPAQPMQLWSLALNVSRVPTTSSDGDKVLTSDGPLAPGHYAVLVQGAGAHTMTVETI